MICQTLPAPAACTPLSFRSQSCAVSVGLITEIAIVFLSALTAANTSGGYVGLPEGVADVSIPATPLIGFCGEFPFTATGSAPAK